MIKHDEYLRTRGDVENTSPQAQMPVAFITQVLYASSSKRSSAPQRTPSRISSKKMFFATFSKSVDWRLCGEKTINTFFLRFDKKHLTNQSARREGFAGGAETRGKL